MEHLKYLFKSNKYNPVKIGYLQKGKKCYSEKAIFLDTETSHNHDNNNPIGWITSWCFEWNNIVVCGRKPTSLIECFNKIRDTLDDNEKIICYVHNLSYDITYLFKYLVKEYGTSFKSLCIEPRKFITFSIDCFEFRCSYKLSNKSLTKWGNDLNVKHKKKVGFYDYEMIHYQDDTISFKEWKYQIYDVLCLKECVEKTLIQYGYTLLNIPLTSTGFIRKDILKESRKDKNNYVSFRKLALNSKTNYFCTEEFAGGMTHGNRYYRAKTIISLSHIRGHVKKGITFKSYNISYDTEYVIKYHPIRHRDFVSHYPSQIENYGCYPVSQYTYYSSFKDNLKKQYIF